MLTRADRRAPREALGRRGDPDLRQQRAHWVTRHLIAWPVELAPGRSFALHAAAEGGIAIADGAVDGGRTIPLTVLPEGPPARVTETFPHLAGMTALRVPTAAAADAAALLRGQIAVSATDEGGLAAATGLQIPGVLDDLYAGAARGSALGATFAAGRPTLRLWAPTAASVRLQLFGDDRGEPEEVVEMARDAASGIWSTTGDRSWHRRFYRYEVEVYVPATGRVERNVVTDPYSVSLATDSTHSQIVDLRDRSLQPGGWQRLRKPALADPADISIYELHVRDFSASDATVPEAHRGKFTAFAGRDTDGMRHLHALAKSGITHLHLLPTFDIATVPENPADRREPDIPAVFAPDSPLPQERVADVADLDAFNWGYDPFHYTVPEGSYATDPDGVTRILEYRQMVQTLNRLGLRVVADVVYSHTHAAGQADESVLDRIVPGYYHRLGDRGQVETSTCGPNTATEHAMMEKLMIDSVLTWATEYKIDGFRFDLMGHHTKANMLKLRAALDALTPARHGVDGSSIHLYGEGWSFGEVADDARFVQATQANMAGTGIGTFNDRLRDAARGGSPFGGLTEQGFATGLAVQPNGTEEGTRAEQAARARRFADLVRIGLAGNLADYELVDASGQRVKGSELDYRGAPAGYAKTPIDNVVYVDKHDNETLFDAIAFKAPRVATPAERVRMQNLALSLPALAQGTPFFQAGSDLLRSKSLDRDSYNSGDHFNRIDWSRQTNNWGVGLPMAEKNEANWPLMGELLRTLPAPAPSAIDANAAAFRELLEIRSSSELFRLRTAQQVQRQLRFGNTGTEQVPGLITMHLSGGMPRPGTNAQHTSDLFVVFNASPEQRIVRDGQLPAGGWRLHKVQRTSADRVVRTAAARGGSFTVPPWTTAVFELPGKGT